MRVLHSTMNLKQADIFYDSNASSTDFPKKKM